MNKVLLAKLKVTLLEKMGYELVDIGEDKNNIWRPSLINQNGNESKAVSIKYDRVAKRIYLYDFAEQKTKMVVLNVSGEVEKDQKISEKELEAIKEQEREYKAKKREGFVNDFSKLHDSGDKSNSLLDKKKLQLFGDAFIATSYQFDKQKINKPLIVPFRDAEDGQVVGAQVCFLDKQNKSKKYAVGGSTTKNAACKLQDGEKIPAINKIPVFLAESYTTACEIAEAMPKAGVYCTAGIGQLLDVHDALSNKAEYFIILVCDKTKHNVENHASDALQDQIDEEKLPFIQLSKTNSKCLEMTDYNDYSLAFGKAAVRAEIVTSAKQWLPLAPEVLEGTADEYRVVSRINNKIIEIPKTSLGRRMGEIANPSFWHEFCTLHNAYTADGYDMKKIDRWLQLEEQRNIAAKVCGMGIFKDNPGYCMNSSKGRYILTKDGKVESSLELKPHNSNLYVNMAKGIDVEELNGGISQADLKRFYKVWEKAFSLDRSNFFALLGFIGQAVYSSFTTHRAHIWFTGPTGSGKSFLMNTFLHEPTKGLTLNTDDLTEAGLAQFLTDAQGVQNATLIALDEAGSDSDKKAVRMIDLIKLARSTASNKGGSKVALKGTADQTGRTYTRTCSLALASVMHKLDDHQDLGRFLIMRLGKDSLLASKTADFMEIEEACEKFRPKLLKTLLLAAPHYERLFPLVNDYIVDALGNARRKLGQKALTLTATLAGTAAIIKVVSGKSDEEVLNSLKKNCDSFIEEQKQIHLQELEEGVNVVDEILGMRIIKEGTERGLLEELEYYPDEYWDTYGIRLTRTKDLQIRKSNFSLHRLVDNARKSIYRVHNVKSRLMDACDSDERIDAYRTNVQGKKIMCWKIKLDKQD